MVATDQQKKDPGLLDELLKHLADKDRLGNAAKGLAGQQMNAQVMPVQMGGGLLQQLPIPQMQAGTGIMGYQGSGEGAEERKAKFIQAMKQMLGMGA
jgi:hypothetical protein